MADLDTEDAFLESTLEVLHRDGRTLTVTAYVTLDGEEVPVADCVDAYVEPTEEELADPGRTIMALLVKEVIARFKNHPEIMKAADFEFVRKLSSDNSITFASVKRGDFGSVAAQVADEFPFPTAHH